MYSEQYAKNKIHLIHNSEEEILNFTKEAINIFHDQNFDLDQNIQKKFWFNFKELIKKQNLENYHGDTRSIMSESFLKSNPEWLQ